MRTEEDELDVDALDMDDFVRAFFSLASRHYCSHEAKAAFWGLATKYAPVIARHIANGGKIQGYKSARMKAESGIPEYFQDYSVRNEDGRTLDETTGVNHGVLHMSMCLPMRDGPKRRWRLYSMFG